MLVLSVNKVYIQKEQKEGEWRNATRAGSEKRRLFSQAKKQFREVCVTPQNEIIIAKCNTNAKFNNINAKCNKVINAKCNNFPTQNVINCNNSDL